MDFFKYLILASMILFLSCNNTPKLNRLEIHWQPVDHLVGDSEYFLSKLTLINNTDKPLKNNGWTVYFNSLRRILKDGEKAQNFQTQGISISLADNAQSGDYYAMKPLDNFTPIMPVNNVKS